MLRTSSTLLEQIPLYVDKISDWIGRSVSWLTFLMMFLYCLVVLLRYVFNIGIVALQESVVYLHGSVFMLGIAYTLKEQAHVRVDILYGRLGSRKKALIDMTGTLIFLLPFAFFIFWTSLDYVSFSWSMLETSNEPGGLPGIFLLKTLIPVLAVLLFLQGLSELIKSWMNFSAGAFSETGSKAGADTETDVANFRDTDQNEDKPGA